VTEAALNGLEERADLDVAGWDLDADHLVVLFDSRVDGSVGLLVNVPSHLLGEPVADVAELLVVAVDLVWVVAVGTLPGVHLKVVGCPALGGVDWAAEGGHGVLVEAHHSLLLGHGWPLDDGGHVAAC